MIIFPAIDIRDGKCVRLTKGCFDQETIFADQPVDMAVRWAEEGAKYLHLVDLDGAKAGKINHHKIIEQIATHNRLKIDFGGGLKTNNDVKLAFDSGAYQVTGGSIAVKNEIVFQSWIERFGADKINLGADVLNGKIAISGWQEESSNDLIPFVQKYQKKGIKTVICTDISKDGMLQGPSLGLYQSILYQFPDIQLVASGGVSKIEELPILKDLGCYGVIIGKAIYENKISLKQLEHYILQKM
jgi:phosphoribosylformimino-5-aminoimidazole carboxamide ribotide isomerase